MVEDKQASSWTKVRRADGSYELVAPGDDVPEGAVVVEVVGSP